MDQCAAHPQDISLLKNVKVVFPQNCTNILQPPKEGAIKLFKHVSS